MNEAREQLRKGEYFLNEEVDKEIDEWLNKCLDVVHSRKEGFQPLRRLSHLPLRQEVKTFVSMQYTTKRKDSNLF